MRNAISGIIANGLEFPLTYAVERIDLFSYSTEEPGSSVISHTLLLVIICQHITCFSSVFREATRLFSGKSSRL